MNFQAWGPFDFSGDVKEFWALVDAEAEKYGVDRWQLRRAIGCYLFSIKHGEKLTPWYVGKTSAQTGFYGEIFTPHKRQHYNAVLGQTHRKAGQILLFTLVTGTGRISNATQSTKSLIEWLERMLIGMAIAKNPDLRNKKDTKLLREVWVEGVFGAQNLGRPFSGASAAKKALL